MNAHLATLFDPLGMLPFSQGRPGPPGANIRDWTWSPTLELSRAKFWDLAWKARISPNFAQFGWAWDNVKPVKNNLVQFEFQAQQKVWTNPRNNSHHIKAQSPLQNPSFFIFLLLSPSATGCSSPPVKLVALHYLLFKSPLDPMV
jgi:hypothetical protein